MINTMKRFKEMNKEINSDRKQDKKIEKLIKNYNLKKLANNNVKLEEFEKEMDKEGVTWMDMLEHKNYLEMKREIGFIKSTLIRHKNKKELGLYKN